MKRRGFLRDLIAGAAMLAAGAVPYGFSPLLAPARAVPRRNYLRPPGALGDDAAFVAACIGCGLCGEVCPPRCIRFHARDGGAKVNTPYIDAAEVACILCDKCMEVCPTEALTVIPREEVDMGIAEICVGCGLCVEVCPHPSQPIWIVDRPKGPAAAREA
jgi:formate hydrogenlyase subunit 6/NADH:ubiquinone oxidoreductase subunit I